MEGTGIIGVMLKCATNLKQLLHWDQTSDLVHGFHQIHESFNVMSRVLFLYSVEKNYSFYLQIFF